MLDIRFIRENKEVVAAGAKKKRINFNVEELIAVDDKRVALLSAVEGMRARQNDVSKEIVSVSPEEKEKFLVEMRELKEKLQTAEEELKGVMGEWQRLMLQVPNVPDMSVPEGDDDNSNLEIRAWGVRQKFNFVVKDHVELMQKLQLADFERGIKVAGFRGYILKNEGATLSFAIWQAALEHFTGKGFTPMIVPSLIRPESMFGTGYLPQGEDDAYKTQDGDYLAGTGEVATMGHYMDEVIDRTRLPLRILAFSPCFRREAGSHGKDTKGLIRVHEFFKLEQVLFCEGSHEESVKWHEELTKYAEEILQALKLPYRVVVNCGGDLGLGQVKKYDIEVWMPSENKYRETHSASYFHDFQTRRLNIRYKDEVGKMRFAHSLNNTAIATPRVVAAIIENYQQADGTILVPEILQKYLGTDTIK